MAEFKEFIKEKTIKESEAAVSTMGSGAIAVPDYPLTKRPLKRKRKGTDGKTIDFIDEE